MKPVKDAGQKKEAELTKWERMKLYSKKLTEKQELKKQEKNPRAISMIVASVENQLPLVAVENVDSDVTLSKKRLNSASGQRANQRAVVKHLAVIKQSRTNSSTEQRPFKFTAQPSKVVHSTKAATTGDRKAKSSRLLKPKAPAKSSPSKTKSPRPSIATSKTRNRYIVPARVDTGLRKTSTSKILIKPKGLPVPPSSNVVKTLTKPVASSSGIGAAMNKTSKTASGFRFPSVVKTMTPVVNKMRVSKRKQSFDRGASKSSADALRLRKSTPGAQVSKRQRLISKSEKRLEMERNQLLSWGKEIDTYTKAVAAFNLRDEPQQDNDEVFLQSLTPICASSKTPRSKSVSFQVPLGQEKTLGTFPRTPRLRLSTGQSSGGSLRLSTYRLRHQHCLGLDNSDVIPKTPTIKLSPLLDPKIISTASTPRNIEILPSEDDAIQQLELVKNTMKDFKDAQSAEEYLNDIVSFFPKFMWKNKSVYWEVKALIAEKSGDVEAAGDIFQQAMSKISEHEAENLEAAKLAFQARLAMEKTTEVKETPSVSTQKTRKRQLDDFQNFNPRIIKFANAKNPLSSKKLNQSMATPGGVKSIMTPVRRSARLASTQKVNNTAIDLEEIPADDLSRVLFVPNPFLG